jgi:alpha-glucosidase
MRGPFAALLLWLALPAAAEALVALPGAASPGKVVEVAVTLDYAGRPGYTVAYRGKPLIEDSRLGFLLSDAPKLERSFKVESSATRSFDETWEQPWGERRFVRNRYNELRVRLRETRSPFRALDVVFRLYDDGLGFRYEFPDQASLRRVNIADELTEFAVAEPATAWWIPAGEWNRYEYLYERTPATEVGQAHTPMTLRTASGVHVAFHEAALVDYSGMWLRRVTGQRFKATLAPAAEGPRVRRTAPFATPWRTIQVTERAGGLYESSLALNLNEPNVLGDVSWFTPAKYVGVWWSLQLGTETWGSGPTHGATTANVKRYVDFAAANGFRGVLVEGWNVGWDREWYFADRTEFSFTRSHPDFDLEALSAYARERGVHLIGHHETGGFVSDYQAQLPAAFDLYARNGVEVIKTGYVADAGGLTFEAPYGATRHEWHDGQVAARHHLWVVQEAAKRRIAIKDHEPIKDTGLRRTYPNWISREGARGMEYNAWADPPNPPEHEANLFFTRMLSGPMDFTPGVLSLAGRDGQRIQSTIAKQLALYVVIYSPLQMAADLPENYARYPGPFQFIRDVPTDWDDTRVLDGEVGDFAVVARKDRRSDDWYVGGVTDEQAREVTFAFDFLEPGRDYAARIYRDADDADWASNPHAIEIETRPIRRGDRCTVRMAPGGGFAVRLAAAPSQVPSR